ncbi:MAG TPA: DUF6178 family protein [Vicinamibacteria bacterium]|nr:DUF6178 family protein [Vicinamibacteria bacterium]
MTSRAIGARRPRHLLERLLDTPNLAQVVPSLEARVLTALVRHCGLEDCGEIVGLATAEQLVRVFDDDLWRGDEAGREDEFDAERFALWLEVLAESGVVAAAQKIVEMGLDFATAALSRHVLALDQETLLLGETLTAALDGYEPLENARAVLEANGLDHCLSADLGGYKVIAKSGEAWDALLAVLIELEGEHRGFFDALMKRCGNLSTEYLDGNGGLFDVLSADDHVMEVIAGAREQRREQEGYVTPSQAAAFLRLARQGHAGSIAGASTADPMTRGYFRELDATRGSAGARTESAGSRLGPGEVQRSPDVQRDVSGFLSKLEAAGVVPSSRPPLLLAGKTDGSDRLAHIRSGLRFVEEHDPAAYARRSEELAYLANVLVAGCSVDSRRFQSAEAADAALAVCNLGLENWLRAPASGSAARLPEDFLQGQDLVTVFRRGWGLLNERVSLHVARRLAAIVSDLTCDDEEVQDDLTDLVRRLRRQLDNGTPWRERESLDVIAILDQPSWSILQGLLDECPVVPKRFDPSAMPRPLRMAPGFEFISENTQIDCVRDFLESLPARLTEP